MYSIMEIEMTTKQELKIKIKEVKEEARKLTIEELAMYLLSENGNSFYQYDALDIVKSWGLVEFVNDSIGLFRTETIRDATPEEIMAWHCTQIWKLCDMTGGECYANCPKRGWCEATVDYNCEATFDYNKSMTILEGKEVILEVI